MRVHGKIHAGMLAAVAAALLMPATAAAEPEITKDPVVSGDTTVGKTVTATGYAYKGGEPSWRWIRCEDLDLDWDECDVIPGATSTSYTIRQADVGKRLRVWLIVSTRRASANRISAPSAEVKPAPPPPTPTPTPTPTATPEPSTTPAPQPVTTTPPPGTTGNPLTPSTGVLDTQVVKKKRKPTMMRPAPVVRIRGRTTVGGARITLLSVKAPRGARISLTCRGSSCPVKRWAKATAITRLLRFERVLAAGTKLTIRVTKPGRIGKYTEIVIRSIKAPWRRDRCLVPGSSRPRRCPAV
jgi:hypothetical protein